MPALTLIHSYSSLRHRNIVRLYGFCLSPNCIVMECIPHGPLSTFLLSRSNNSNDNSSVNSMGDLSWEMRLKIATDIAEGMSYLHSLQPPIIHRDLKTPNILVCLSLFLHPLLPSSVPYLLCALLTTFFSFSFLPSFYLPTAF